MDTGLRKKALISGVLLMGLGHILFLKQQIKGAFLVLLTIAAFCLTAFERTASGLLFNFNGLFVRNIRGFITLGVSQPDIPVRFRDHSIFMMIDGLICIVIVLALIAVTLCPCGIF